MESVSTLAVAPLDALSVALLAQQLPTPPTINGENLDGDGESFSEWLECLELVASTCKWDDEAKLVNVATCLQSTASGLYCSCTPQQRSSYNELVTALHSRFTPVHIQSVQSSIFHERRQHANKTTDDYAQDLCRLFYRTYSSAHLDEEPQLRPEENINLLYHQRCLMSESVLGAPVNLLLGTDILSLLGFSLTEKTRTVLLAQRISCTGAATLQPTSTETAEVKLIRPAHLPAGHMKLLRVKTSSPRVRRCPQEVPELKMFEPLSGRVADKSASKEGIEASDSPTDPQMNNTPAKSPPPGLWAGLLHPRNTRSRMIEAHGEEM